MNSSNTFKHHLISLSFQPILKLQFKFNNFFDIQSWGIRKYLLEQLESHSKAGFELLDVGVGTKPYLKEISDSSVIYYSCDLLENLTSPHSFLADANSIQVADGSFDLVTSFQVLEHLQQPWVACEEWGRVLKNGGRLILTTNFFYPIHGSPNDFFRFSSFGLVSLLNSLGFEEIDTRLLGSPFSLTLSRIYYNLQSATKFVVERFSSFTFKTKIFLFPLFLICFIFPMPLINILVLVATSPLLILDRFITSQKSYIIIAVSATKSL